MQSSPDWRAFLFGEIAKSNCEIANGEIANDGLRRIFRSSAVPQFRNSAIPQFRNFAVTQFRH
jgi:hypothetical protein